MFRDAPSQGLGCSPVCCQIAPYFVLIQKEKSSALFGEMIDSFSFIVAQKRWLAGVGYRKRKVLVDEKSGSRQGKRRHVWTSTRGKTSLDPNWWPIPLLDCYNTIVFSPKEGYLSWRFWRRIRTLWMWIKVKQEVSPLGECIAEKKQFWPCAWPDTGILLGDITLGAFWENIWIHLSQSFNFSLLFNADIGTLNVAY